MNCTNTCEDTNMYEDKVLLIRESVLLEICLAVPASPSVYLFLSNPFIFGCAGSLMQSTGLSVATHRLSLVAVSGGYSLVEVRGLLIVVACLGEHWLQGTWALVAAAHRL